VIEHHLLIYISMPIQRKKAKGLKNFLKKGETFYIGEGYG